MDIQVLLWFQSWRTPWLDVFFGAITRLGEQIPLLAAICALYWCINKRSALYIAVNFLLGSCANNVLKLCLRVERPWLRDARLRPVAAALDKASGYSFPSHHTAAAVAFFGGLSRMNRSHAAQVLCWLCALLVGVSRLYLGVHTPQDVLVSLAIGIALLPITAHVLRWVEAAPCRDLAAVAVLLALVAFAILCLPREDAMALDAFKMCGGVLGFALGWLCERRCIGFEPRCRMVGQVFKFCGGIAIALLLYAGAKEPLNALLGDAWGGFIRYALVTLFVLAGWPYLFTQILSRAENAVSRS